MWNKADLYEALAAGAGRLPGSQGLPGTVVWQSQMTSCRQMTAPRRVPAPLLKEELERFAETPLGPWRAAQLALLRERGRQYAAAPIPPLPYSAFRLYKETGDRAAWETPYFDRRGRLLVFALLCWLEPDEPDWQRQLEDTVWAVCAEPFWCVPAHFQDPEGRPLPLEEYAAQLDLFACETAFALAEVLALCGGRLDEAAARQAELQIERRVFAPFLDGGRLFRFETMRSNWSAVCGGAIGGAALHLMTDRARLTGLLHRCLSCIEVYLDSFGEDGVSTEGVDYWTYGFGFFVCFADLLAKRTGGRLDLLRLPKVRAIAQSQQYYHLAPGRTVSFADSSGWSGFRMGLSCRLQGRFADIALPDAAFADDLLKDGCYRFCLALRDLLWYDPAARFGLPAARSVWLPDAQWLISCGGPLALAAKGGNNGESHNHNDCGSFILCKNGQALLCDLGSGRYDAAYFGPDRYRLFLTASRSHNIAMPAGCEQTAGPQYACRGAVARLEEGRDRLELELAGCYACPELTGYRRVFEHDKAAGVLTLTDTFAFTHPRPVTEVFVSETPIRLEEGRAVFAREGTELSLCFDPGRLVPALRQEEYPPHSGPARTAYLLHLTAAPADAHICRFTLR